MSKEIQRQLTTMARGVNDFHEKVVDLKTPTAVQRLPQDRREFRAAFLREELEEFLISMTLADDIDALIDLVYVAIGALLEMGVNPIQMFEPVQEANMQKVRGETKRGHVCDAQKPAGWTPPDHEKVIEELRLRYAVSEGLLQATAIRLEREKKYNRAGVTRREHFPLGAQSIFQMMHVKYARLKADVFAGLEIDVDHPLDLINYSDFLIDLLQGRL